jgi:hypothetical protein
MRRTAAILIIASSLAAVPVAATAKPHGYIGPGRPVGGWRGTNYRQPGEIKRPSLPRATIRSPLAEVRFSSVAP